MARRRRRTKSKYADLLISDDEVRSELGEGGSGRIYYAYDRENIVSRMTEDAREEAKAILRDRFDTVAQITYDIRDKMDKQEKQYSGIFQDDMGESEDRIFLPKTREDVNEARAYILSALAQLQPLVRFRPAGTTVMWGGDQDYKRAKLGEAMFDFYARDVWQFIDNELYDWITDFLMHPIAILKMTYMESEEEADLLLEVTDRALMYLHSVPHKFKKLGWCFEEFWLPLTEVYYRRNKGDWVLDNDDMDTLNTHNTADVNDSLLDRLYGRTNNLVQFNKEDELVQCFEYWQAPGKGLPDVYGVIVGGIDGRLARFGRNPFPYKGLPYIGKSFNPKKRPDGDSLVDFDTPFQKVLNTFYEYRNADVRKNLTQASIVPQEMVDDTTMDDIENGQRLVRTAAEFTQQIMQMPNRKMSDFMAEFPSGTSTIELLQNDIPLVMNLQKSNIGLNDIQKGATPEKGVTLGATIEALTAPASPYRPVLRQVGLMLTELAERFMMYARDPIFYPTDRIVRIIGKGRYEDVIQDWHQIGDNTFFKSVSADDMDVDVTFDAMTGMDELLSNTLIRNLTMDILQAAGTSPELMAQLSENVNFSRVFMHIIHTSGVDIEGFLYSDREKQENNQKKQQQQQQAMQQQAQMQQIQLAFEKALTQIQTQANIIEEQNKQMARTQSQVEVDKARGQVKMIENQRRIESEADAQMEQIITKIVEQKMADAQIATLENELEKDRETHEAKLERESASVQNVSQTGGGNIQSPPPK